MTSLANCPKCHSVRSVEDEGYSKKCRQCRAVFFISTRKKRLFPSEEVKKLLEEADIYRSRVLYKVLKGKVMQSDREFISQSVQGSLLVFRQHSGYLDLRGDKVYFVGRVQVEEGKRVTFEALTDMSVEEYKLYLASDPNRTKQLKVGPKPPYNLYVSFMEERKPSLIKHLVEVGVDINFESLDAALRIDGSEELLFVSYPFPMKDIVKLQKRENKYRSLGELEKRAHIKSISTEKTKRTYRRFLSAIFKEAMRKLGLKTNETIKYVFRIENPQLLRNFHTQWTKQGWRPTLLKNILREKQKHVYIEIEVVKPQYTSIACNKCGKINERNGKIMKCECGEVIDFQRNAAINILNKNKMYKQDTLNKGEVGCLLPSQVL